MVLCATIGFLASVEHARAQTVKTDQAQAPQRPESSVAASSDKVSVKGGAQVSSGGSKTASPAGRETVTIEPGLANHPEKVTVTAHLDQARSNLQPDTGAIVYKFSRKTLKTIPGGHNAPLNQVLLQAPGVAQDSYGQIHVRGDHNEVQFRLDGVQLPEGLSVFGQALMTRFADSMSLTTGALPSEFGFLQAAVVDITTKNGTTNADGNASIYGGTRDYFFSSLQYGGHHGKWDYFATADFVHDRVGIENTTGSFNALHDLTNQYHFLGHLRYTADGNTRISWRPPRTPWFERIDMIPLIPVI